MGMKGQGFGHIFDQGEDGKIDELQVHPSGFDFGKVQEIVDQLKQVSGGLPGDSQAIDLFVGEFCGQGQVDHAHDAVEGRADFMTHVGQEEALGPVGRKGRFPGLFQVVRGFFTCCDVDHRPHMPGSRVRVDHRQVQVDPALLAVAENDATVRSKASISSMARCQPSITSFRSSGCNNVRQSQV